MSRFRDGVASTVVFFSMHVCEYSLGKAVPSWWRLETVLHHQQPHPPPNTLFCRPTLCGTPPRRHSIVCFFCWPFHLHPSHRLLVLFVPYCSFGICVVPRVPWVFHLPALDALIRPRLSFPCVDLVAPCFFHKFYVRTSAVLHASIL